MHYFTILHVVKEKLVPILVFIGVIAATITFHGKASTSYHAIDGMKEGLKSVLDNTPPGSNFSFKYIGDTSQATYALMFMRYILAPRHISNNGSEYDTALIMCDERVYDRAKHYIEDNRKVLSKVNHKRFYFLATCSK